MTSSAARLTSTNPEFDPSRIIVALDVPTLAEAEALIAHLTPTARHFKIGHHLQFLGGLDLARQLASDGYDVFLDTKLHDIPNTVAGGIAAIGDMGVGFVTVHAYPQTMEAAVQAAEESDLKILAVSVLTSMGNDDLADAGYSLTVDKAIIRRARQARDAGVHGLVCSPADLSQVRQTVGTDLQTVTPGVRPADAEKGDQKRVATPAAAISDGADYLVIGRPIVKADDPLSSFEAILASLNP